MSDAAAAPIRPERYRTSILAGTRRAYQLALEAFEGGQFEYLRVVQGQRAAAEASFEYIRNPERRLAGCE